MTPEQIKLIKKFYKPPFRYDPSSDYIMDSEDNLSLDVRGYGRVQYEDDQIQRDFGQLVAELLNERLKG